MKTQTRRLLFFAYCALGALLSTVALLEREGAVPRGTLNISVWICGGFVGATLLGYASREFFRYLDTGKGRNIRVEEPEITLPERVAGELRSLRRDYHGLMERIKGFEAFSDKDIATIRSETQKRFLAQLQEEGTAALLEALKAHLTKNEDRTMLTKRIAESEGRIFDEVDAQRSRSNINLYIGIVLGVTGMTILGTWLFQHADGKEPPNNWTTYWMSATPRLGLAVAIEVLAFFFLRLYRAAAAEIRYYHNELTNLESRNTALIHAHAISDSEASKQAISNLLGTERNFILQKDQTTVHLEHLKGEIAATQANVSALKEIALKAIPTKQG
jgi:hypothetical protein